MVKLLILAGVVLFFGILVMYNHKLMAILSKGREKSENIFYRLMGKQMQAWNVRAERAANLNKDSRYYKINVYLKEIITNLGMTKDNVTPVGLLVFISSISFFVAVLFVVWTGNILLAIPSFGVIFYFVLIVLRFMALSQFERKEREIMDTVDLIAMDVKGGIYNAIQRYQNSFHPNVKPFFDEFLDNIQRKGYGFNESMKILASKLGPNFDDFAQKAIIYENKADKDMDDIFSAIIETNRYKRQLRKEAGDKFNELRVEFTISVVIITVYGLFSIFTDDYMHHLFTQTNLGKFLLLVDVMIVAAVLSYISSIKSKFL